MTSLVLFAASLASVAATADDVRECVFLDTVKASAASVVVTESTSEHLEKQAIKRIRIRAYRKGGDTVLITSLTSERGRSTARGEAYLCDQEVTR